MDVLIDLSWRAYPAAVLLGTGSLLAIPGLYGFWAGMRPPYEHASKTLAALQAFRRGVIGLAVMGLGAAWIWQLDWLLVLALVIGGEETLESTIHVQAVSMSERWQRAQATAPRRSGGAHANKAVKEGTNHGGL